MIRKKTWKIIERVIAMAYIFLVTHIETNTTSLFSIQVYHVNCKTWWRSYLAKVYRWQKNSITILFVHLKYTTYMIEIDVADQFCENRFFVKCCFASDGSMFCTWHNHGKCFYKKLSLENMVATNTNDHV